MTININSVEDIARLLLAGEFDIGGEEMRTRYGNVKVTRNGDLALFNYTNNAAIENTWNQFECLSRGLIINAVTGEVVARPFPKFFNLGQKLDRKPTGCMLEATEKMDGSLGIFYRHDGQYLVSTRGSFDGPQAQWATSHLNLWYDAEKVPTQYTLLFEIIYPDNRVVVDYGDREDLVLIGVVDRFTGEELPFYSSGDCVYKISEELGFPLPKIFSFNAVNDVLEASEKLTHNEEGYVLRFSCGTRLKIKGDKYLTAHRILTNATWKNIVKAVHDGSIDDILHVVPDEFTVGIRTWVRYLYQKVKDLERHINYLYLKAPKATRKEYAEWVMQECKLLSSLMFARMDEKPLRPIIFARFMQDEPDAKQLEEFK